MATIYKHIIRLTSRYHWQVTTNVEGTYDPDIVDDSDRCEFFNDERLAYIVTPKTFQELEHTGTFADIKVALLIDIIKDIDDDRR